MKQAPCISTIPPEAPFLKTLAAWILAEYGADGADLAQVRVFLPNRRACRALREALLDAVDGKPMLLPRIQPVGDLENDDLPAGMLTQEAWQDLPMPMPPERRLLLLTRLVMQFESTRDGHAHAVQAMQLARQLARFMDEIAREQVNIDELPLLVPAQELAIHWEQTIEFLKIISVHWPEVLRGEGVIDPVVYRNRLLQAVADAWQKAPPAHPVIAAGSTGTQPATALLLARIARLPEGRVVLPGLDKEMPEPEWEMLAPTHPQYTLKTLLKHLGAARHDVQLLVSHNVPLEAADRVRCLRAVFQPAPATAHWLEARLPIMTGMRGMRLLEADTLADEACMIAVALRETLETPKKTAALVTPDRELARMVAAQMRRFGIEIDDSAGIPLLDTPPGHFLRLAAELVTSQAAPVALLSALQHPLAAAGRSTVVCRDLARKLDKAYLRGVRFAPGLSALVQSVKTEDAEILSLLKVMEQRMRRLAGWVEGNRKVAPAELLKEHLALAEWLAGTAEESGAARLWAGDDGNQLAETLATLHEHLAVLLPVESLSYARLFETLLTGQTYRPRYGRHPRLHILGPLEARLQRYDKMILGGLNEESWPARPAADPWMSRPMREAFGLPPLERAIGQSAHDVFQLCAAPEVLLTRARKVNGTPAVPSRWLERLHTLLSGKDTEAHTALCDTDDYHAAQALLNAPAAMQKIGRPEPKPPTQARLTGLRVTAVDHWQDDPYRVYARYILNLQKLDALDEEPDAADFGNLVHEALKLFAQRWPQALPDNPKDELLACGEEAFKTFLSRPAQACLWWPRFEAIAGWLAEQETVRRRTGMTVIAERRGRWPMDVDGAPFMLTTSIDRLEMQSDGQAVIVDYKTGAPPTHGDVEKGRASQLPLEALIAQEGTLDPALTKAVRVGGIEYWYLAGNAARCEVQSYGTAEEVATLLETCRERLQALVRQYRDPAQPFAAALYPDQRKARHDPYDHLARRAEWMEA